MIDEGHREALRIECGTSIPSGRLVRVMDQLIELNGKPEAIRMDNGPELTLKCFEEWAAQHRFGKYNSTWKAQQNAYIERFYRSFRTEVLNAKLFNTIDEVQEAADQWVQDYNEYRPHESLGNIPPAVFKPRVFNAENSIFEMST